MEFLTRPIERWLWPRRGQRPAVVSRWRLAARYAYALARDLATGDLNLRAMSLVYTTMVAIVPLLAFAFAMIKGLGLHRDFLEPLLLRFLTPLGNPRAGELTQRIVGFVDNVSGLALGFLGIAILLFTALSMAQKVEGSFNFVWRVDRPRSFARRFSEYLAFMLVGPLVMSFVMGFTALLGSTAAIEYVTGVPYLGTTLLALGSLLPYVLIVGSFSFLYVFVPNTRVRLKPALIGGLFAGILWAGGGSLFTTFVVSVSRLEAIYSGFAIVFVAMAWLYLSWLILLLGAQLAFYVQNPDYLPLGQRAPSTSNSVRERLALTTMLLVGRDFEKPGHGWRIESLSARIRVPRHMLEPVATALMSAGLLARTSENRLIPGRDLRRIELADILATVRSSEHDLHHDTDDVWSVSVDAVAGSVEDAIRKSLGGRTLADLVDAETRADSIPS
jgi:membrane protein